MGCDVSEHWGKAEAEQERQQEKKWEVEEMKEVF